MGFNSGFKGLILNYFTLRKDIPLTKAAILCSNKVCVSRPAYMEFSYCSAAKLLVKTSRSSLIRRLRRAYAASYNESPVYDVRSWFCSKRYCLQGPDTGQRNQQHLVVPLCRWLNR